jgi:hypothetical protein
MSIVQKVLLQKVMLIFLVPVCCWSQDSKYVAKNDTTIEFQIKEINKITANLEGNIDSNQLFPFIESKINYNDATEGVSPEIRFYFDEKNLLIAARVEVGFETWGKTYYYFFDGAEKIMKYLCVTQGGPAGPWPTKNRTAIIFNPEGKILWKNTEPDEIGVAKVLKLYSLLMECEDQFSHF